MSGNIIFTHDEKVQLVETVKENRKLIDDFMSREEIEKYVEGLIEKSELKTDLKINKKLDNLFKLNITTIIAIAGLIIAIVIK